MSVPTCVKWDNRQFNFRVLFFPCNLDAILMSSFHCFLIGERPYSCTDCGQRYPLLLSFVSFNWLCIHICPYVNSVMSVTQFFSTSYFKPSSAQGSSPKISTMVRLMEEEAKWEIRIVFHEILISNIFLQHRMRKKIRVITKYFFNFISFPDFTLTLIFFLYVTVAGITWSR